MFVGDDGAIAFFDGEVSSRQLRRWRADRQLPYHRIGWTIVYSIDDLAAFAERHRVPARTEEHLS